MFKYICSNQIKAIGSKIIMHDWKAKLFLNFCARKKRPQALFWKNRSLMLLENSTVPWAREQVSAAERASEWSKQCGASKQVSATSEWASRRGQLLVHNISNSEMDAMCTALLSRWRANIQICTYSPEHKSSPIHKFHCCMSAQARAQKILSLSYYAPAPGPPKSQTNTLGLPLSR